MKEEIWKEPVLLSPSLISVCDLCNLERSVESLRQAGIRLLHVDILDGSFSPSMPLGLETVRQLRTRTDLALEAHIMANENEFFVEELLDIGVSQIVIHAETEPHLDRMLSFIRNHGVRAGVALKPATSLSVLDYVLERCDTVLLMLINPGYAQNREEGQVPYAARKIHKLRRMIRQRQLPVKIEIDGRISREDICRYGRGEADIFVAGSTCLDKNDLQESASQLCRQAELMLEGKRTYV